MALVLDGETARNLGVAIVAGLAVGIEREWSGHAAGPAARFAGARTFLLLGLVGGIAGWLARGGADVLAFVTLGGGAALTVAAYVMAARRGAGDVEGTTEVAALAVLALGTAAGLGFPLLTSAATSVMVLALAEKTRIREWVRRIGERELAATLEFAVLALVVLPLLPTGPYGPYGSIQPRTLWSIVLLISGLSFAGYVARRGLGPAAGYALTGLLGGIVSSTAVTLTFASQSRRQPAASAALAWGVVAASAMVVPRVLIVATALNPAVAVAVLWYCTPPLIVSLAFVAWILWHRRNGRAPDAEPEDHRSPLRLASAIRLALVFQAALIAVPYIRQIWGAEGVLTSALVLGVTDIDALVLSMARLATSPETVPLAARGIVVGLVASAVFKISLALVIGSPAFRRRSVPGLFILGTAAALGLWLGAP